MDTESDHAEERRRREQGWRMSATPEWEQLLFLRCLSRTSSPWPRPWFVSPKAFRTWVTANCVGQGSTAVRDGDHRDCSLPPARMTVGGIGRRQKCTVCSFLCC